MRKFLFLMMMVVSLLSMLIACSDDEDAEPAKQNDQNPPAQNDTVPSVPTDTVPAVIVDSFPTVKQLLDDSMVVSTKVVVNGEDKTLVPTGCPTIVDFAWEGNNMVFRVPELKIGNMPFSISFEAMCNVAKVNDDAHVGDWYSFTSYDATVVMMTPQKNGASMKGYVNPTTKEIEFAIDYNVMGAKTDCERQTIDTGRLANFAEEMQKYVAEMQAIKEGK